MKDRIEEEGTTKPTEAEFTRNKYEMEEKKRGKAEFFPFFHFMLLSFSPSSSFQKMIRLMAQANNSAVLDD